MERVDRLKVIYNSLAVMAFLIDGAALVQISSSPQPRTYGEYCDDEISDKIKICGAAVKRVDLALDIY